MHAQSRQLCIDRPDFFHQFFEPFLGNRIGGHRWRHDEFKIMFFHVSLRLLRIGRDAVPDQLMRQNAGYTLDRESEAGMFQRGVMAHRQYFFHQVFHLGVRHPFFQFGGADRRVTKARRHCHLSFRFRRVRDQFYVHFRRLPSISDFMALHINSTSCPKICCSRTCWPLKYR